MRRNIPNDELPPILKPALDAAHEIGCQEVSGYTMGRSVLGLCFKGPQEQLFAIDFNREALGSPETVRRKILNVARRHGILVPS